MKTGNRHINRENGIHNEYKSRLKFKEEEEFF